MIYQENTFLNIMIFTLCLFKCDNFPDFIRFSPGANFIALKENIFLRSKKFDENLINFIDYSKYHANLII